MILVDTSVWIDFLQEKKTAQTTRLDEILELKMPFGITGQIYQEVLQGASSEKDFNALKEYFETFRVYAPSHEKDSYLKAAEMFFLCQRKGITIRSTADCLIAQVAREHHLKLFHNDKDFDNIAKVIKDLDFF